MRSNFSCLSYNKCPALNSFDLADKCVSIINVSNMNLKGGRKFYFKPIVQKYLLLSRHYFKSANFKLCIINILMKEHKYPEAVLA